MRCFDFAFHLKQNKHITLRRDRIDENTIQNMDANTFVQHRCMTYLKDLMTSIDSIPSCRSWRWTFCILWFGRCHYHRRCIPTIVALLFRSKMYQINESTHAIALALKTYSQPPIEFPIALLGLALMPFAEIINHRLLLAIGGCLGLSYLNSNFNIHLPAEIGYL